MWSSRARTCPPNLKELIAWLKANPDKATEGTAGPGSGSTSAESTFRTSRGRAFSSCRIAPAPSEIMRDLVAGHIDLTFDQAITALAACAQRHGQSLCSDVEQRASAAAPTSPTVDEAGAPGVYISTWYGLVGAEGNSRLRLSGSSPARPWTRSPMRRARPPCKSRPGDSAARAADRAGACRAAEGRDREMVAADQGRQHQGRVSSRVDLIIRNARLADRPLGRAPSISASRAGRIAAIERALAAEGRAVRRQGRLACPGLIETHIHLDKSRIIDRCAPQERRDAEPGQGRHAAEEEHVGRGRARARRAHAEDCILHGTTRMRTQVEVDPGHRHARVRGRAVADRRLQMGNRHRDLRLSAGRSDQLSGHRGAAGRRAQARRQGHRRRAALRQR